MGRIVVGIICKTPAPGAIQDTPLAAAAAEECALISACFIR